MPTWFEKFLLPLCITVTGGLILLVLATMGVPSMIMNYLGTLPAYVSYFIWAVFVLLVVLEVYLGYRWGKQRGSGSADNYRTIVAKTAEIETLKGNAEKFTRQQEAKQNEVDVLQGRLGDTETEIRRLVDKVRASQWLTDRAESERTAIAHCVRVEDFVCKGDNKELLGLCFWVTVRNPSVFPVVMEEAVQGYLTYKGQKWTNTRITLRSDIGIASGDSRGFGVQYNLRQDDLDHFWSTKDGAKDGDELLYFDLRELRIMIRGADPNFQVIPQPLKLENVRIRDEAKRIER